MKRYLFYTIILTLLINGCKNGGVTDKSGSPGKNDQNSISRIEKAFPVSRSSLYDMEMSFRQHYKTGINSGIDTTGLGAKVADLITKIDTSLQDDNDSVYYICFSHAIKSNCFTYTINMAKVKINTTSYRVINLKNSVNKYLYLKTNGSKTFDSIADVNDTHDLYLAYRNAVNVRKFSAVLSSSFNSINAHPTQCYYKLSDFRDYLLDNQAAIDADLNLKLLIKHGAINVEGIDPEYKVHTPLLCLDVPFSDILDRTKPYYQKAMDIGNLCPPNCPNGILKQ